MRRTRAHIVHGFLVPWTLVTLGGGCESRRAPTEPGPGQSIRLVSNVPDFGATLGVRECTNIPTVPLCTPDLVLTVGATYDRPIPLASSFVEFYTGDGRRCAAGSSPRAPLSAGTEHVFEIEVTYLSFPPNQSLLCPLPVTTSRLVVILVDVSTSDFRRILTREFDGSYSFRMSGSAP